MRLQLKLAIFAFSVLSLLCASAALAQHTITGAPPAQTTANPQQGAPSQALQGLPTTPAQSAVTGIPATTSAGAPDSSASNDDLVIGNGDLIEVSVYGAQDFDKKDVCVDNDGKISLPFVGAVTVGGLTVRKAEERVANALSKAAGAELDSLPITFEAVWRAVMNNVATKKADTVI
jgi:protein involved in polysaccharide export with SLBB domain